MRSAPLPARDLLEIQQTCLALHLRKAERLVNKRYDEALRGTGLRMNQFTTLVALAAMKSASISAVAEVVGIERSTLSRNIEVLKELKLVSVAAGEDQRERELTLTPKGNERLALAHPRWRVAQQEVREELGASSTGRLLQNLMAVGELGA